MSKDFLLHFGLMDTDRAAGDFRAVDDKVVGQAQHTAGIGIEPVEMFRLGRGKRMVRRVPALLIIIPFQ